jgi:hypothetical protein
MQTARLVLSILLSSSAACLPAKPVLLPRQEIRIDVPTEIRMQGKARALQAGETLTEESVCLTPQDASAIASQKKYMQSLILPAYELGRQEAASAIEQARRREESLVRYIILGGGLLLGGAAFVAIERLSE